MAGKRKKTAINYEIGSGSEDEVAVKRTTTARTAKKDAFSNKELLFGPKSKLIDLDLAAMLLKPKAWQGLSDEVISHLKTLLPAHMQYDERGSPIQSFLRYDSDWKSSLREFQYYLEQGRYEPEWLDEAAVAMEERAAGIFDNYKEQEYEEFWGQKQKLKYGVIAGEQTNLKFEELIKAGLFQPGDVLSYARAMGQNKKDKVLIEKDCVITVVNTSNDVLKNNNLSVSIPPGQYKYHQHDNGTTSGSIKPTTFSITDQPPHKTTASQTPHVTTTQQTGYTAATGTTARNKAVIENPFDESRYEDPLPDPRTDTAARDRFFPSYSNVNLNTDQASSALEDMGTKSISPDKALSNESLVAKTSGQIAEAMDWDDSKEGAICSEDRSAPKETDRRTQDAAKAEITKLAEVARLPVMEPRRTRRSAATDRVKPNSTVSKTSNFGSEASNTGLPTIIVPLSLQALENKIIEVDGRVTNPPNGNAWKCIRCLRNNQDRGSLWEMREEYFVYHKG